MNNITGQPPKPEWQLRSEEKQTSNDCTNRAKNQKGPAEFAEWVHNASLELLSFEVKAKRIRPQISSCPAKK